LGWVQFVHTRTNSLRVHIDRSFRSRRWRLLALFAIGLTFAACNKSPVKLNPVTGKVLFKDQPAEGAQIVFQPAGETEPAPPKAFGTVGSDGSYSLYTDPYGEGAMAGDYHVMITWFAQNPRSPDQTINKLPPKYSDQTAPLLKATVKEGKNDIPPCQLKP
jgi:hypothetical protein